MTSERRKPKVQIFTQGCSANVADSEAIAGLLFEGGFEICQSEPDVVVLNTCTVKGPTETAFIRQLRTLEDSGTPVVIAGCLPQAEPRHSLLAKHSVVGPFEIAQIANVTGRTLRGEVVHLLSRKKARNLSLPVLPADPTVAIIPIAQGCLSSCTFCKTKQARGILRSVPRGEIMRAVRDRVAHGAREVWLTSQDNSAYGFDLSSNLAELLSDLVELDGDFRIRVGMANPDHFRSFWDDFCRVIGHEKIFRFVHIPVQSGSNAVLEQMKREYRVEEFEDQIVQLRERYPEMTFATDMICGFPTESVSDFEQTLSLVSRLQLDVVNISRFWPRPGTPAAKLKPISGGEVKRRSRVLTEVFRGVAAANNRRWHGWSGQVFFRERGKQGEFIGRNFAYKQVVLSSSESIEYPGSSPVQIVSSGTFSLRAEKLNPKKSSRSGCYPSSTSDNPVQSQQF
ncbi:MAG: tRNA (N(6)-L-threonylcarbamoyladenosine(37)-C(2))-methylthiotransferase [Bdellovibrionales bacterium]|nr:tRNA (N(6)-L-threonylcarbamoyladenosine(37)-C(2))-methylthiotransferase [Bdellovibrionales bacterium]